MRYVWDVKITQVNVRSKLELDIGLQNVSHSGWICYVNVVLVSYGGHNS
jgi:hypothetical protein